MINLSISTVAEDCLTFMQNGSELMKIRSNSRQYQRFFFLEEDLTGLRWRPSSKKPEKARSEYSYLLLIYILMSYVTICIFVHFHSISVS